MYVTDEIVFLHLPKCGGSSVYDVMQHQDGFIPLGEKHNTFRDVPSDNQKPVVITLRNPWAWYVSFYSFISQVGGPELLREKSEGDFQTFFWWMMEDKDIPVTHYFEWERCEEMGVGPYSWLFLRASVRSEEQFTRVDEIELDDLGPDCFVPIEAKDVVPIVLGFEIGRLNQTEHEDYTTYYTEEMTEEVKRKDALMLRLFGYDFTSSPDKCFRARG